VGDEADGFWWTIPKAKTKNVNNPAAFDLRVPLIGRAETVVRRRLARYGKGYLFPQRNGNKHIEQKIIQTGVFYSMPYSKAHPESTRPRLTVTKWSPHDLRRTVRTMLASMDCPRDVAESILGHMLGGVEGTYNLHRYDRQRREWLTSISDKLEALATTRKP
jgi:integrase